MVFMKKGSNPIKNLFEIKNRKIAIIKDYGYTADTQVAYIETNLYDVKTEKLIWSTRSQIEITEGESQLINSFIRGIIRKLSSDKIIH